MAAFLLMLIGHALADYPLQGDWLARAKNRTLDLVPGEVIWPGALAAHAGIHAGAVLFATGVWFLASCEFVAHVLIDDAKCRGRLTYNQDQAAHVACKAAWALWLASGLLL